MPCPFHYQFNFTWRWVQVKKLVDLADVLNKKGFLHKRSVSGWKHPLERDGMSVSPYTPHFHFRVVAPERARNPTRNASTCCWSRVISFTVLCLPTGRVKRRLITKLCSAIVFLSRLMYGVHDVNKMTRYALAPVHRNLLKPGINLNPSVHYT
jgi:hypothetical protein